MVYNFRNNFRKPGVFRANSGQKFRGLFSSRIMGTVRTVILRMCAYTAYSYDVNDGNCHNDRMEACFHGILSV